MNFSCWSFLNCQRFDFFFPVTERSSYFLVHISRCILHLQQSVEWCKRKKKICWLSQAALMWVPSRVFRIKTWRSSCLLGVESSEKYRGPIVDSSLARAAALRRNRKENKEEDAHKHTQTEAAACRMLKDARQSNFWNIWLMESSGE